ncbi:MAG: hypothetical protein LIO49_01770 [Ruminococcus sp.]|nr:hypothetical protein [Ruminococcus sp.]
MKNILAKLLATLSAVFILSSVLVGSPIELPSIPTHPPVTEVTDPYEPEGDFDDISTPQYDEPILDDDFHQ